MEEIQTGMSTRIYIDSTVTATRYLDTIPYPSDITALASIIPNLILQMDFDATDSASLARNRVGAAATAVGSPVMSGYGVTLNETNYINTGIDISAYNGSDLTMISIVDPVVSQAAIIGVNQFNAPQRSRGICSISTVWRSKWITSAGTGQGADVTRATPTGYSEMLAGRFIGASGSTAMSTKLKAMKSGIEGVTAQTTVGPYALASNMIRLGASVDAAGTQSVVMRAALVASRAMTDAELATIYLYYKNYYSTKSILI